MSLRSQYACSREHRPCSEAQLLLEVEDILGWAARLVCRWLGELLLNDLLHKLLCLDASIWGVHLLIGHEGLDIHLGRDLVACWHDVVVVHVLDERLHTSALGNPLLGHHLCALERSTIHSGNKAMTEGPVLGTIVEGFHNDRLLSGIASLQANDDAACLDELAHGADKDWSVR